MRKKPTRDLENTCIPIAVWFVTQSGYQKLRLCLKWLQSVRNKSLASVWPHFM